MDKIRKRQIRKYISWALLVAVVAVVGEVKRPTTVMVLPDMVEREGNRLQKQEKVLTIVMDMVEDMA